MAAALSFILLFASLARGARDLWAASLLYIALSVLLVGGLAAAARNRAALRSVLGAPLAAFLAVALLSYRFALKPADGFLGFADLAAAAAAFWLALSAFDDERGLCALRWAGVAVVAGQVVTLLAQQRLQPMPWAPHENPGTLVNANVGAGLLLAWLPVFWERRSSAPEGSTVRRAWALALAALGWSLAMTASMWAVVCAGGFFVVDRAVLARRWHRTRPRVFWPVAIAFFAAAAVLVAVKLGGGAGWIRGTTERLGWWRAGLEMFAARPWTGVGPGNFGSSFLAFKGDVAQNTIFAHGLPVSLLSELGALGAGAALWLALSWGRAACSAALEPSRRPFLVGAVLLLVYSSTSVSLDFLAGLLSFALFAGAAVSPAAQAVPRPRWSLVAVVAGVAAWAAVETGARFVAGQNTAAGHAFLVEGRAEPAAKAFQNAVSLAPDDSEAWRGAGLAAALVRDWGAAAEAQRRAVERAPLEPMLWRELAQYEREAGRREAAMAALRRAAELHRSNPRYRAELSEWEGAR